MALQNRSKARQVLYLVLVLVGLVCITNVWLR